MKVRLTQKFKVPNYYIEQNLLLTNQGLLFVKNAQEISDFNLFNETKINMWYNIVWYPWVFRYLTEGREYVRNIEVNY